MTLPIISQIAFGPLNVQNVGKDVELKGEDKQPHQKVSLVWMGGKKSFWAPVEVAQGLNVGDDHTFIFKAADAPVAQHQVANINGESIAYDDYLVKLERILGIHEGRKRQAAS